MICTLDIRIDFAGPLAVFGRYKDASFLLYSEGDKEEAFWKYNIDGTNEYPDNFLDPKVKIKGDRWATQAILNDYRDNYEEYKSEIKKLIVKEVL